MPVLYYAGYTNNFSIYFADKCQIILIFELLLRKGKIYDYKKLLFSFTPYFITDLGAITGVEPYNI